MFSFNNINMRSIFCFAFIMLLSSQPLFGDAAKLLNAARKNNLPALEKELASGTPIESRTKEGYTALALAAYNGNIESVELLINKGANLEAKQKDGLTPFILAANRGQKDILKILAGRGADKNARSDKGATALFLNSRDAGDAGIEELLLKLGADPDPGDHKGITPLMRCSGAGRLDLVDLLLKYKASPLKTDLSGKTAWAWAYNHKRYDVAERFRELAGAPAFPAPEKNVRAIASNFRRGLHLHIFWFTLGTKFDRGSLAPHSFPAGVSYPSQKIYSVEPLHPDQTVEIEKNFFGSPAYRLKLNKKIEVSDGRPLLLGFAADVALFEGLQWEIVNQNIPRDGKIPDEVRPFMALTPRYDFNSQKLKPIISDILKDDPDYLEVIHRVRRYVHDTVHYEPVKRPNTASDILTWGKGRCGEFTRATIALLRGSGIPARAVWGLGAYPWLSDSDHAWVECWIPGYGWVAVQPQRAYPDKYTQLISFHTFYLMTRYSDEGTQTWQRPSKVFGKGLSKGESPNGVGVFVELPEERDRRRYLGLVRRALADVPGDIPEVISQSKSFPADARPFLLWLCCGSQDEKAAYSAAELLVREAKAGADLEGELIQGTTLSTKALGKLEQMMKESPQIIRDRINRARNN